MFDHSPPFRSEMSVSEVPIGVPPHRWGAGVADGSMGFSLPCPANGAGAGEQLREDGHCRQMGEAKVGRRFSFAGRSTVSEPFGGWIHLLVNILWFGWRHAGLTRPSRCIRKLVRKSKSFLAWATQATRPGLLRTARALLLAKPRHGSYHY